MSSICYNQISFKDLFNKDSSEGYGSVLCSMTNDFNASLRKNMTDIFYLGLVIQISQHQQPAYWAANLNN